MKKYLFLAAAVTMMASCSDNNYVGDNTPNSPDGSGAIAFGGGFKAVTRANSTGAEAADLLGNQFIVLGVKGDGTGTDQTPVFSNYVVTWSNGTAKTTQSNTSNWEYVGNEPINGLTTVSSQTVKFWDYNTTAYDFAAFSVGKGNTIITTEPAGGIPANSILATPIKYAKASPVETAGYTLKGSNQDLAECYITDMKTVAKADYKKEVKLEFRSLASKVRMAIYETVPGYSVQNVHFYSDNTTAIANNTTISSTDATLFGTNAFCSGGLYTITFPTIGSGNSTDPDYNKAHVAISGQDVSSTQSFGTLNYTSGKLATSSASPSYAGTTEPYYVSVLPNENAGVLEMRVNYELISDDGSGEVITVHGAKAYIPAAYTKWLPNYAYTYIFKISDNTNGWTSTVTNDPAGLYPITFDAVVLDQVVSTDEQTTITTVAMPSITTYQKDHATNNDEYAAGDIYVQVMNDGTLITDLDASGKSYIYELGTAATEAEVMDALNLRASEAGTALYITGRNGLKLTPGTLVFNETDDDSHLRIPGEDGKNITVDKGKAARFTGATGKYYAFVYQSATGNPSQIIYPVVLTSDPGDWVASDANIYYSDPACTEKVTTAYSAGTYYRKYTDLNNTYAVKVIKVQ